MRKMDDDDDDDNNNNNNNNNNVKQKSPQWGITLQVPWIVATE